METPAGYGVVLVTAGNMQEAEAIANALVEAKLAACVSLLPIHSIYTWQGELHKEQEWQLLIKTDLAQFPALEAKIKELHSYEDVRNYCFTNCCQFSSLLAVDFSAS